MIKITKTAPYVTFTSYDQYNYWAKMTTPENVGIIWEIVLGGCKIKLIIWKVGHVYSRILGSSLILIQSDTEHLNITVHLNPVGCSLNDCRPEKVAKLFQSGRKYNSRSGRFYTVFVFGISWNYFHRTPQEW